MPQRPIRRTDTISTRIKRENHEKLRPAGRRQGNVKGCACMNYEFAMERRLREMDPGLHRRFTETVFALQRYLSRYRLMFPEYSDHSELHSLTVIDFCNRLAGDQITLMNADELYVLLMGCYLHDSGMGITMEQYRAFCGQIDFGDYFDIHDREDYPTIIRDFHHEFSGCFIRRYAELLEIPSDEHLSAIVQVARGHRKTDLTDRTEYPGDFTVPGGNRICLPYLAALIRLADEIDVAASRNPALLFDIESLSDQKQIMINRMIEAVRTLEVTETAFILHIDTGDQQIRDRLCLMVQKMQKTLDYCRKVVQERTPYKITQRLIVTE